MNQQIVDIQEELAANNHGAVEKYGNLNDSGELLENSYQQTITAGDENPIAKGSQIRQSTALTLKEPQIQTVAKEGAEIHVDLEESKESVKATPIKTAPV